MSSDFVTVFLHSIEGQSEEIVHILHDISSPVSLFSLLMTRRESHKCREYITLNHKTDIICSMTTEMTQALALIGRQGYTYTYSVHTMMLAG